MEVYNPASDNKYYRFLGFEAETVSGLLVNTYEEPAWVLESLLINQC